MMYHFFNIGTYPPPPPSTKVSLRYVVKYVKIYIWGKWDLGMLKSTFEASGTLVLWGESIHFYKFIQILSQISTLLDRIAHVCITTAHARRSGRSAKLEINKPSTSKLVRLLDEKLTVCLSPILHSALIFAHAQFYLRGCLLAEYHWMAQPAINIYKSLHVAIKTKDQVSFLLQK